jgi:hypothetical protein
VGNASLLRRRAAIGREHCWERLPAQLCTAMNEAKEKRGLHQLSDGTRNGRIHGVVIAIARRVHRR